MTFRAADGAAIATVPLEVEHDIGCYAGTPSLDTPVPLRLLFRTLFAGLTGLLAWLLPRLDDLIERLRTDRHQPSNRP